MECVRLRVKDVDFARGEIVVRQGKGARDRITVLPQNDAVPLKTTSAGSRRSTKRIWKPAAARSISPMRSPASVQVRHGSGRGSMCFPPARAP